jgi:hypothetical protein
MEINTKKNQYVMIVLVIFVCLIIMSPALAAEKKKMGGWELGSPYNAHYSAAEVDRIRVTVRKIIEVVPMKGMAPGVALVVRETGDDEDILVHIGPKWFMKTGDTGINRGDQLKIRGCWAEIDGKDVFMGAKLKKGDFFSLKVRLTKDGTPFWTMSPEQLAHERANQ